MGNIRIVSEPREDSADAGFVRDGLALFNVAATGDSYYSPLAIFLKDERGRSSAAPSATLGRMAGPRHPLGHAEPLRGKGYGRKPLEAAEEEAGAQGCRGVYLTTFSFQSKGFYERLGYEVVADIPDYPVGHTYHVLKKTLEGG